MSEKQLFGGRSPGEIAEHELTGRGSDRLPSDKRVSPRHEEPRKPEPERRKEEDAPQGIAEIDIESGQTVHEEHVPEPTWRPPGETFDEPLRQ